MEVVQDVMLRVAWKVVQDIMWKSDRISCGSRTGCCVEVGQDVVWRVVQDVGYMIMWRVVQDIMLRVGVSCPGSCSRKSYF